MESIATLLPLAIVITIIVLVVRAANRRSRQRWELNSPFQSGPSSEMQSSQESGVVTTTEAVQHGRADAVSDEVPEGWYPDPDGKPCARYWDGESWKERTRPLASPQKQGEPPSTHAATPTTAGAFGYRASDNTFHGTLHQLMPLAVRAVQSCGWTVTGANEMASMLTFETKVSWGSWSGITCSLTFQELAPGIWRVTGTGKQNVRGAQAIALDMGESTTKVSKAIDKMKVLAPKLG